MDGVGVRTVLLRASSALAFCALPAGAAAQSMEMPGMTMPMAAHPAPATAAEPHAMAMTGALGPYPMARESSGTSWQPDTSDESGLHVMSGEWMLMAPLLLLLLLRWRRLWLAALAVLAPTAVGELIG